MIDPGREIGEDDLQAFVDDQLALEREAMVQQYLRAHPGEAQRVAAYKAQRNQLRALFAGSASEPLPPKLQIRYILGYGARRGWTGWRAAAAIMLAATLGVASGWLVWAPMAPGLPQLATQVLVEQALATYAVYAPDERHPVEMSAADEARLTRWLSERLRRTVTPPDLSEFGYKLLGGRSLATERGGAAAMLMYSNAQGTRVSLLLRPMIPSLRRRIATLRKDPCNCASGSGRAWDMRWLHPCRRLRWTRLLSMSGTSCSIGGWGSWGRLRTVSNRQR